MRTVDPDVWFRAGSVHELWSRKQTDQDLETRLRRSLWDAAHEFWRHASLRGSLITKKRWLTKCDTARNLAGATGAFVLAIALVSYNIHQLWSGPLLQVNTQSYSTTKLRYPGVALCSNNVISKDSLREYIRFLLSQQAYNRTYGANALEENILNFGAFLTMTQPPVDVLFMDLLQHKDPNFNVTNLMYQLSPKCYDLLKACAWEGTQVNCSKLFAMRITPLGFCCVFNSRYRPEDLKTTTWTSQEVGQNSGLIVMYTENDENSAYVRRPALGVEVLLFDGDEYPLLETGVARLYPVQRNASMFFSLHLQDFRATAELGTYIKGGGQCRIRDFRGHRSARSSYAWCLLECRRRTVAALCNCVPFTLMPHDDDIVCTPNHLPCLIKHKEKFIYHYPGDNAGPGLTEELQDSLACEGCLPDCGRPVYSADVASTSYSFSVESKLVLGLTLQSGLELANSSVMRFYYNSNHQPLYIVEPALRWYEGVATIACHWVLLLNVSLITIMELIFHFTFRLVHHFRRRTALIKIKSKLDQSASIDTVPVLDLDGLSVNLTGQEKSNDMLKPPVDRFYF